MEKGKYIRIYKVVEQAERVFFETRVKRDIYEFYFTSIANCARWLGVSYNAVKFCLRGDYKFCENYTIEYVDERPDERDFFIDPDKYRNPDLKFGSGERYIDSAGQKSHWANY